jgi:hypothetical protein
LSRPSSHWTSVSSTSTQDWPLLLDELELGGGPEELESPEEDGNELLLESCPLLLLELELLGSPLPEED